MLNSLAPVVLDRVAVRLFLVIEHNFGVENSCHLGSESARESGSKSQAQSAAKPQTLTELEGLILI